MFEIFLFYLLLRDDYRFESRAIRQPSVTMGHPARLSLSHEPQCLGSYGRGARSRWCHSWWMDVHQLFIHHHHHHHHHPPMAMGISLVLTHPHIRQLRHVWPQLDQQGLQELHSPQTNLGDQTRAARPIHMKIGHRKEKKKHGLS